MARTTPARATGSHLIVPVILVVLAVAAVLVVVLAGAVLLGVLPYPGR